MVGSLLAKASLSAKASRLNHTQELQPPAALNDDEQVQAALPQRAAALNPSQAVEAGGRELVWGHEEVARLSTNKSMCRDCPEIGTDEALLVQLGKGVEAAACPPSLLPPPPAQQQSVAQPPVYMFCPHTTIQQARIRVLSLL